MNTGKIIGVVSLTVIATLFIYIGTRSEAHDEMGFRTPLTAREINGLAATQVDCNRPYELTEKGALLHRRFTAQKKMDNSLQVKFNFAMAKYRNLTQDQQCALQEEFSDLLRRWRD